MDTAALLWSVGLLALPLVAAVPVSSLFKSWLGSKASHSRYREAVRRVLNSGSTLRKYRAALDEEARLNQIDKDRQSRIETAMLFPLNIVHFMFVPAAILSPAISFIAFPVGLIIYPVIALFEFILIRLKALIFILHTVTNITDWQVIGVRPPYEGSSRLDPVLVSVHRLPTPVLLGLFAYLVALYLPLEFHWIIFSTVLIYVILASFTSVLTAAVSGPLVFAATAERRMITLESFVQERIQPIVGVGLIALVIRQMFMVIRTPEFTPFDSPVQFSLSVLAVLYSAAIIGLIIEFAYNRRRGDYVGSEFVNAVIERNDPELYAYIRKGGEMSLISLGRLGEIEDTIEDDLSFDEIASAPSAMSVINRPEIPEL